MNKLKLPGLLICLLSTLSCDNNSTVNNESANASSDSLLVTEYPAETADTKPGGYSASQYDTARQKIIYGNASLAEVRLALTEKDTAALTNTVHALFSMRWHRGVFKLLYKMWELDKDKYPEINWEQIGKAPVRIALASTLNRIQISDTKIFQFYIRSFQEHQHEFIRAQVVVALGFNGDPVDIPYLRSMIEGDNDYVAQSAIAGLGLMNNIEAQNTLIALRAIFAGEKRGLIIDSILRDGYDWSSSNN